MAAFATLNANQLIALGVATAIRFRDEVVQT
jgi:hypothetical protein